MDIVVWLDSRKIIRAFERPELFPVAHYLLWKFNAKSTNWCQRPVALDLTLATPLSLPSSTWTRNLGDLVTTVGGKGGQLLFFGNDECEHLRRSSEGILKNPFQPLKPHPDSTRAHIIVQFTPFSLAACNKSTSLRFRWNILRSNWKVYSSPSVIGPSPEARAVNSLL